MFSSHATVSSRKIPILRFVFLTIRSCHFVVFMIGNVKSFQICGQLPVSFPYFLFLVYLVRKPWLMSFSLFLEVYFPSRFLFWVLSLIVALDFSLWVLRLRWSRLYCDAMYIWHVPVEWIAPNVRFTFHLLSPQEPRPLSSLLCCSYKLLVLASRNAPTSFARFSFPIAIFTTSSIFHFFHVRTFGGFFSYSLIFQIP